MIVVFQSWAIICLVVGLFTDNTPILSAASGGLGGTLGIGIRLLRQPPTRE
jgi:hypothetical protein